MKRGSLSVTLYLSVVFLSGAAVGAFGHYFYTVRSVSAKGPRRSPEQYRQAYISEMKSRLKLSQEQEQKLIAILDETGNRHRKLRESTQPESIRIQKEHTAQVLAILSPDQQIEYEKMRKEREAHMKRREPSRGK